ncbi:chitin synthase-domain-containing protein [Blastocladiella britannica]|nr:chitin synthase-domain-containing protein [Blastocladiella britannica]
MWYSRIVYGVGNEPLIPSREPYDYIVLLPVYNEALPLLTAGIQSIIDQNYFRERVTLHISFDSDERSKLYLDLVDWLNEHSSDVALYGGTDFVNPPHVNAETIFGVYQGVRVFVHKFPHGGKRSTQAQTFLHIEKQVQLDRLDRTILVLLDSDNFTYDNAFHNIASTFDRRPEKRALSGYMTCMSSGDNSSKFWNLIQDVEYLSGEMGRSFELMLGTVNCLPGGFTAVRLDVMEQSIPESNMTVAERYFGELPIDTLTDYHRCYLGEDRYLSHLLHQTLPRYSMGFCPAARAKTDPPPTLQALVRQRRRWFLGALSNEVYMLTDREIWSKFGFLCTFKTIQLAFRTNFFSQVVMSIFAFADVNSNPSSYIPLAISGGIPLLLNYLAALATAIKLGHSKVFLLQPVMLIVMTISQLFIDFHAVFTFTQRSWGGPRHAAQDDDETEGEGHATQQPTDADSRAAAAATAADQFSSVPMHEDTELIEVVGHPNASSVHQRLTPHEAA